MYENTEKLQSNEVEDLGAKPSTIPLEMEQLPGESIFDYTQRIRKEMIINSCASGVPSDPKDVAMINNILNSMDAQEVNKARIANEDKAANADKEAIAITTVATAEKNAAQARADARLLESKAQSESEILLADAAERKYAVDAVGKRELNEADNLLSAEQIAMKVKLELIKALPEIIAQSVKPMENIEGIKILQVNGLAGGQSGSTVEGESSNLADQMTNSALRYRAQAPLVDSLMNE